MTYDEWEAQVPAAIKGDAVWKIEVYRLARFLGDLAWPDVTKLMKDERTRHLAAQMYDSVGGIGGTFSEGFSRSTGKERARFYEYALGSARETRDWHYMARFVLGERVANSPHRPRHADHPPPPHHDPQPAPLQSALN